MAERSGGRCGEQLRPGNGSDVRGPGIADVYARLHDREAAEFALKTKGDSNDSTLVAMTHFVHGRLAAEAGDVAQAIKEMEAFGAGYAPMTASNYPGYNCWIAPAEEAAGNAAKADAVLQSAGAKFVDCYRFRADILDHRGDWAGAQKAYADGIALAPDLPAAYYSWGRGAGEARGPRRRRGEAHRGESARTQLGRSH